MNAKQNRKEDGGIVTKLLAAIGGGVVLLFVIGVGLVAVSGEGRSERMEAEVAEPSSAARPTKPAAPAAAPSPTLNELLARPEYTFSGENTDSLCREKWTKRGELNGRMYKYCRRQQKEGYDRLTELAREHDFQWMGRVTIATWQDWTKRGVVDYQMVAHNLEGEVDNFLSVQYESKQASYDGDKMRRCLAHGDRFPSHSWSQAWYCYENL